MWRRAFQFATAASFVLCLAVHTAWLRSHFCSEKVIWANRSGWRSVGTAQGHLQFGGLLEDWSGHPASQFHGPKYERSEVQPPYRGRLMLCSSYDDIDIHWEHGGFAWNAKFNWKQGMHYSIAVLPCWFLAGITLFLPLAATTLRLRTRRAFMGRTSRLPVV